METETGRTEHPGRGDAIYYDSSAKACRTNSFLPGCRNRASLLMDACGPIPGDGRAARNTRRRQRRVITVTRSQCRRGSYRGLP